MYCAAASAARLNHWPDTSASSIHCFSLVGYLNNDRLPSRQPIQSCACPPTYPFPPSIFPNITLLSGLSLPKRVTKPAKSTLCFTPSYRRSQSQSWRVYLDTKACRNRRDVFSSMRCNGGLIGGDLSAVWRDGPRWDST